MPDMNRKINLPSWPDTRTAGKKNQHWRLYLMKDKLKHNFGRCNNKFPLRKHSKQFLSFVGGGSPTIPLFFCGVWSRSSTGLPSVAVCVTSKNHDWRLHCRQRLLFVKVLNVSSPALRSAQSCRAPCWMSSAPRSLVQLSLLLCVSVLLWRALRPWRRLKHTATVHNEAWV